MPLPQMVDAADTPAACGIRLEGEWRAAQVPAWLPAGTDGVCRRTAARPERASLLVQLAAPHDVAVSLLSYNARAQKYNVWQGGHAGWTKAT